MSTTEAPPSPGEIAMEPQTAQLAENSETDNPQKTDGSANAPGSSSQTPQSTPQSTNTEQNTHVPEPANDPAIQIEAGDQSRSETPLESQLSGSEEPHVEPNLNISREQTPDVEDELSSYTDSAAASSDSENETSFRRKRTPSLAMDRAVVKRTRSEEPPVPRPNSEPTEPEPDSSQKPLATKEKYRKRVSGKMIDRLWERLDGETFKSFESLCEMSMGKVLERFEGSSNRDTKIEEAQRLLTQHWLSDKMPKSFLARLRMTKLPPTKSIIVRTKGMKPGDFDPLNIDQASSRKAAFESYLSAEMKQLESLEAYHQSLTNTYNVDQQYLNDFRRTTSNLMAQIAQEREENSSQLHLNKVGEPPKLRLAKRAPAGSAGTRFDPNKDDDVVAVLRQIESKLQQAQCPKKKMLAWCDQLDVAQQQLLAYRARAKSDKGA